MPPLTPTSVSQFANLTIKSRLMTAEEVQSAQRRWQASGRSEVDVDGFRKSLVQAKQLTEYQSALLNRGHTDGYFLGEYTIIDLIGKGRMAGVYRAKHASGQIVAIKVLPPSKAKEGQFLARFQRESKLLTRLNHPNVVRAFQAGESGGRHYFVMEAIEGETLDEILEKRKKLPPLEAVRLIYQAMQGVQHIHEKGMIHRDLKPANLILSPSPGLKEDTLKSTVKILDIGLGRMAFDDTDGDDPQTQLTGENVLLGTPDYLAPEQARNAREVDIRADIYALGCTLFHCLTGRPPFPDTNVLTQILRHATESMRPLSEFMSPVPDGLQQVLNTLTAKDPGQRYPTPQRAAMALELFLKSLPEANKNAAPVTVQPGYQQWLEAGGFGAGTKTEPALGAPPSAPAPTPPFPSPTFRPPFPNPAPVIEELPVLEPLPVIEPLPTFEPISPPTLTRGERTNERKKDGTDPRAKPLNMEDFDIEVVMIEPPPKKKRRGEEEPRGLLELDRRDFLMLGLGGGGVCFAILVGMGLAKIIRKKENDPPVPSESTPQEKASEEKS